MKFYNSKFEQMKGKYYFFTLNQKDYIEDIWDFLTINYVTIGLTLNEAFKYSTDYYSIYPELSKSGKLHYHGIIRITDMIKWYRKALPILSSLGLYSIQRIDSPIDLIRTSLYCRKDWYKNRETFLFELRNSSEVRKSLKVWQDQLREPKYHFIDTDSE